MSKRQALSCRFNLFLHHHHQVKYVTTEHSPPPKSGTRNDSVHLLPPVTRNSCDAVSPTNERSSVYGFNTQHGGLFIPMRLPIFKSLYTSHMAIKNICLLKSNSFIFVLLLCVTGLYVFLFIAVNFFKYLLRRVVFRYGY